MNESGSVLHLDLTQAGKVGCDVTVPKQMKIEVLGDNGKIILKNPANYSSVNLKNGNCEINLDDKLDYKFDLDVKNGSIDKDAFVSFAKSSAILIKVNVLNGKIKS